MTCVLCHTGAESTEDRNASCAGVRRNLVLRTFTSASRGLPAHGSWDPKVITSATFERGFGSLRHRRAPARIEARIPRVIEIATA